MTWEKDLISFSITQNINPIISVPTTAPMIPTTTTAQKIMMPSAFNIPRKSAADTTIKTLNAPVLLSKMRAAMRSQTECTAADKIYEWIYSHAK